MALGTPVAGAAAYSAASGTTVTPAYPTSIAVTDAVLLFVGQKPTTANGGTVTTPTGWTLRDELTAAGGYGTTIGADTGNTNLRVYSWGTPIANQTGNLTVTLAGNNVSWAFIVRVPSSLGTPLNYGAADGQRTTTPTSPLSIALTNGTTPTDFEVGDLAIWAMCVPTDVTTPAQFSAESITATGVTFGTAVEINEPDSGLGNDIGGYSAYATVTAGSSTTAPTVTATLAGTLTNVRGPVVLIRIREGVKLLADVQTYNETFNDADLLAKRYIYGNTNRITLSDQLKYRDTFDYSNGELATVSSGNWTNLLNALDILNGQFYEDNSSTRSYAAVSTFVYDFLDDHESEILISALGVGDRIGPAVRLTSSGGYVINVDGFNDGGRALARVDGTTATTIGTVPIVPVVGDTLKLRVVGNQIFAYINNVLIDTVIDNTYSTGQPGIYYNRTNVNSTKGDNFVAYSIGVDSVALNRGRILTATPQTYTFAPNNVTLTYIPAARILTAEIVSFLATQNDSTLLHGAYASIVTAGFNITGPPPSLIGIADSHTINIVPPAGYALHLVTDVSQAGISACIYYGITVLVGDQILYRTTTETNAWVVTIDSLGLVSVSGSGTDTLKFHKWTPSSWSAELTYNVITANNYTLTATTQSYSLIGNDVAFPIKKIRYVNTASTTGGTGKTNATIGVDRAYATLRSVLETEQADFVAQNIKLEIYCTGGADSSSASQNNWLSTVTGPNNDIKIYAATGNEAEESFNSNKYHISRITGAQEALYLTSADNLYISFYNIQIKSTLTTHAAFRVSTATSGVTTGKIILSGCYIEGGANSVSISFNSRNQPHVIVNSIILANSGTGSNTLSQVFYNNTVISYSTGAAAAAQSGIAVPYYMRNNIFQNYGGGVALSGTLPTNTSSNITNDATSAEVALRNITLIFKDKANKNYRLISEDSASIGSGTNLSADPIYPFTVDLLGNTRTSWDIGAVKYIPLLAVSNRIYTFTGNNVNLTVNRTLTATVKYFRLITEARQTDFSDDFNRADESLDASANWERADTDIGSLSITTNRVTGSNIGNVYTGALANNQWAEFTFSGVAPSGTSKGAAILLRATGGSTSFTGYTVSLERSNTETGTDLLRIRYCLNLASLTNAFSAGALLASVRVPDFANNTSGNVVLRAEVVGSTITAYIDGSPWLFVTDAQSSSGKVGIWSDSANIDNFNSGSFTDTLFLNRGRILTATTQTYAITPTTTNLNRGRILTATTQTYAITPTTTNLNRGRILTADVRSYTLTRNDAGLLQAHKLVADVRSYTVNTSVTNLVYTTVGSFTLAPTSRAYILIRNDAGLLQAHKLVADVGTYTLTRNDANLNRGERLVADVSSYTLTRNDANLLRGEVLVADTRSYTLTRNDANLLRGEVLVADTRSYTLTRNDANLLRAERLLADTRSYTFTRNDANLLQAHKLVADTQTYTLTRNPATLIKTGSYAFAATVQTYTLTRNDANLLRGERLVADTRSYTLTRNDVSLLRGEVLVADTRSYTLTRNDANLNRGERLVADTRSYTLATGTVSFRRTYVLPISEKSLDLSGYVEGGYVESGYVSNSANLLYNRRFTITSVSYVLTRNDALISRGGFIKVWTGSVWVSKPLKVWNGTAWVSKPLKVWNGTTWRTF